MHDAPTFEALKNLLVEQLGVEEHQIKPDTRIAQDLGADSLDAVEIVMAAEEQWDIQIDDEQVEGFLQSATVQQALELIQRLFTEQQ